MLTRRGQRLVTWILVPTATVCAFFVLATFLWMVK